MPKQTLLDMTQSIMSSMDSDEVNSIDDTIESLQVAQVIKDTYYEVISLMDWPIHSELIQLNSGTVARPTHMKLPVGVKEVKWVEYNIVGSNNEWNDYRTLHYKEPMEFFKHLNHRKSDEADIDVITDASGVKFNILNNEPPRLWTSFDDTYIVMDSYDSSQDSTLQNSKSSVWAIVEPSWQMIDTFIPDLPIDSFSLLLEESRSVAFAQIKQTPDEKSEQRSVRQRRTASRKSFRAKGGIKYPDYGRKPALSRLTDPTFRR